MRGEIAANGVSISLIFGNRYVEAACSFDQVFYRLLNILTRNYDDSVLTGCGPEKGGISRVHVAIKAMRILIPSDIVLVSDLITWCGEDLVLASSVLCTHAQLRSNSPF